MCAKSVREGARGLRQHALKRPVLRFGCPNSALLMEEERRFSAERVQ